MIKLGVLTSLRLGIREEMKKAHDLGFNSCQICCWDEPPEKLMTDENERIIKECMEEFEMSVSTFWCGWSGPAIWDFYEGPKTLGLVPEKYREIRAAQLKMGSDFAKRINVENIATHVGFIPETPDCDQYKSLVECLRDVTTYVKNNGQYFLFETGQETPVTLLRTIEDVGTGNLGLNLDPANLILYGKANPVDALDVIGKYVRDIHGKDGCYPTNGKNLGEETPLGEGKVNFPKFIARLKELGYDRTITIEREITGDKQVEDIKKAKALLESLI